MPKMHLSFELLIEWNFAPDTFLGEVRIRSVRILIGLGLTWFTRYWFSEESISPLAKPFLTLPLDSYFVRTQSMEAPPPPHPFLQVGPVLLMALLFHHLRKLLTKS